jgi:hypothetical protein
VDYHTRKSERGMELREFAGAAPLIELHLRPTTGTEPAGAADVMEILMSPHPPQKATPWLGVPRGFPATPAELGQLARLDFATTGFASSGAFAYSDGPASGRVAPQPAALTPELPPQAEPPSQTAMAAPAPAETSAPAEPPPPELVTKALPVTLHGLAAPRGKAMQTFTSAITAASDIQIPPSATLPLRPAIVFGPSPAPTRPPVAATAPAQPKPAQPKPAQSKPPQSKPTQPEKTVQTAPTERVKPSVVPPPKPVPVKRSVAPETPIQERNAPKVSAPAAAPANQPADQRADSHLEPRPESSAHRSLEASAATDAAFPSLRLEATEGAWAKLSMNLKIGVAAAVIVGVSGIAFVVTRGGSKTNGEAPAAAASVNPGVASGVPISGGWIDDWANAAKTRRHISLLSGSAKLSDYRMEFQAQIETKAIGWIFRGLNPRNYYVAKLETITPGLEPTVALVHFAVVDGQDEDRVVVPLPMKVRVDTNYKIRFDAIGTRFTAWIQDQKIAEWTDSRFGSGGVGFFSEQNEKAAMQGTVNVVALVPKN